MNMKKFWKRLQAILSDNRSGFFGAEDYDQCVESHKQELEEREKAEAERQRREEEILAAWFFREEYLNAGWFKRLLLTIEFLIRDKHGEGHIPHIPDKVRMEIARCLLPDIIAFFESEKGQKEFEERKAQRAKETEKKRSV
mgnify:FL=1